jgi:hypothetical protein
VRAVGAVEEHEAAVSDATAAGVGPRVIGECSSIVPNAFTSARDRDLMGQIALGGRAQSEESCQGLSPRSEDLGDLKLQLKFQRIEPDKAQVSAVRKRIQEIIRNCLATELAGQNAEVRTP